MTMREVPELAMPPEWFRKLAKAGPTPESLELMERCYERGFPVPCGNAIRALRGDDERRECRRIAESFGVPEHYVVFNCFANLWRKLM